MFVFKDGACFDAKLVQIDTFKQKTSQTEINQRPKGKKRLMTQDKRE